MKKLSLLVALALLVSLGAFAQVSLDYSVTGSAELIWGVRLDEVPGTGATHGFETKTSSTMDLTVTLDPAEVTKGGSGIYGEITLSGFGVAIGEGKGVKWGDAVKAYDKDGDNYGVTDPYKVSATAWSPDLEKKDKNIAGGTDEEEYDYTFIETGIAVSNPSVAAKIVLSDNLFVKIASKPDFDANIDTISNKDICKVDFDFKGGLTVGYTSDAIDVNAMLASKDNYESNKFDKYAAGVTFDVKAIDIVSISGKAYYTESMPEKEDSLWFLGLTLSSTPIDMLTINFDFAAELLPADGDGTKFSTDGMEYEIDLDVPVTVTDNITVTPRLSYANQMGIYTETGFAVTEDDLKTAYPGVMDVQLKAAMTGDASLSVALTAKDILPVTFDVTPEIDPYDNWTMDLEVSGSYKASLSDTTYVKPGFSTKYDWKKVDFDGGSTYNINNTKGDGIMGTADDEVYIKAGYDDVWNLTAYVEAALIDNTVFTLKWVNDQLIDVSDYKGDEAGDVTFSCKISY